MQVGFPGKSLGLRAIIADIMLEGLGRAVRHRFKDGDMQRMMGSARCGVANCSRFSRLFRSRGKSIFRSVAFKCSSMRAYPAAKLRRSRAMAPGRARTLSTRPLSSWSSESTRALS